MDKSQVPEPPVTVEAGDEVVLGGRTWLAVHPPGHTHDHLCLFDPADGLLLSGDHVLPTITPHINGIGPMDDPLATFFRSLERMQELPGVTNAVPYTHLTLPTTYAVYISAGAGPLYKTDNQTCKQDNHLYQTQV